MQIKQDSPWPPPGYAPLGARPESWAAWWSGDVDRLRDKASVTAPNGYWASRARDRDRPVTHLPLAGDIARRSARLVASDTPALDWGPGATAVADGWDQLSQQIGWSSTILEACQITAALGGAYLRPGWDTAHTDLPLLTVVRAHEALPTFRYGQLVSVTFHSVLNPGERDVYRWLEHHEPGQIRHELWLGTESSIGRLVPLAEHPVTAGITESVIDTTPIRPKGLLVDYVPNLLPNPLTSVAVGRPDIQGTETLLDQLDFTWDSWMRDLRLGRKRIIVASEYLTPNPEKNTGNGILASFFNRPRRNAAAGFDTDAEVFIPLDGLDPDTATNDTTPGITPVELTLRTREHAETVAGLIENIVSRAGYSPQTFGQQVDGQLSGTAIRRREHASYSTRDEKRRYTRPALERTAETLMLIAKTVFGGSGEITRPTLTWVETQQSDPMETAQTINLLRQAQAASDETVVRMAHPEWDDDQVGQEVAALAAQHAARTAPVLTGFETPPGTNPDPEEQL